MSVQWLESEECTINKGEIIYPKDKIKFEQVSLINDAVLVLNWDAEKCWLKFAVMDFYQSNCDGSDIKLKCLFHGEGPSSGLRECRHTYWGEDGYLFYPNGPVISKALKELSKYYDDLA